MQNLESRAKSSGRVVISLCSELRYFSQSNRGQKQQKEPRCPTDISAGITPEKPRDAGDRQHNQRGKAPAVIGRARSPRACQNQQRRNDREKKKDVIEIQTES